MRGVYHSSIFALICAVVCLFSVSASAQMPEGFMLGGGLSAGRLGSDLDSLNDDDDALDTLSLHLMLGYGINQHVLIYLGGEGGSAFVDDADEDFTLASVDLGVRLMLPSGTFIPYGEIGIGSMSLRAEDETSGIEVGLRGSGLNLGGGVMIQITEQVAIDLGLKGLFGRFTEFQLGVLSVEIEDDDATFTLLRLRGGLVAFF